MPHLTRKSAIALLIIALGVLASALWLVLRSRNAPLTLSQPGMCEGWEKATATNQGLGWDLTYMSSLKKIGLCPGHPVCEEWAKPEPPIQKHITEWQADPIVSSFEIELPDGHASMSSMWFIRTKDQAYYWPFYPLDKDNPGGKQPIPVQEYDKAFDAMACWKQAEPPTKTFGPEGYVGFLRMYKEGKSRQMLLTHGDVEWDKDPDKVKPGRLPLAMKSLVAVLEELQKRNAPAK